MVAGYVDLPIPPFADDLTYDPIATLGEQMTKQFGDLQSATPADRVGDAAHTAAMRGARTAPALVRSAVDPALSLSPWSAVRVRHPVRQLANAHRPAASHVEKIHTARTGTLAPHYHRAMKLLSPATVQRHPSNQTGRDFVFGDLHGCVDALAYLLDQIAFDPGCDRLFSVGDLVDRGSQSEAALALLDKPWFYAVLGNHEDMLCAVAEGELRREWWYGVGGSWAASLSGAALEQHARRLRTLPLVRVVGSGEKRFNVLHAEFFGSDADLDAGPLSADQQQQILWGRELATGQGITGNTVQSAGVCRRPIAVIRRCAEVHADRRADIRRYGGRSRRAGN